MDPTTQQPDQPISDRAHEVTQEIIHICLTVHRGLADAPELREIAVRAALQALYPDISPYL